MHAVLSRVFFDSLTEEGGKKCRDHEGDLEYDKPVVSSIIAFTNAVVDPWAVLFEAIDAFVAQIAVTTPRCPDHFAVWAEAAGFDRVKKFYKVYLRIALELSWIT